MQFAEDFLTNKKGDPQHRPSIDSCLVRMPGTINSKCGQVVKVIQRWDGQKLAINYLLRDFRRWLINERMKQRITDSRKGTRAYSTNSAMIWWIERLLQIPIHDYRKFGEAFNLIKNWLDKCNQLRSLDFNPNYMIKYNINSAKRNGYLPISLEKLKTENVYLYSMLTKF